MGELYTHTYVHICIQCCLIFCQSAYCTHISYQCEFNCLSLLILSVCSVHSSKEPSTCTEEEPPLSASLLKEWTPDVELKLNPEEMDALQQELELGAPDVFFREFNL